MRVARSQLGEAVPAAVQQVVRQLNAAGRGWLVGGTVRDLLLDRTPRDYDVATDLEPEAAAAVLGEADLRDARFGTVRVASEAGAISITTLRADGSYGDHRHPDSVQFKKDLELDARRRDFTINALYYDLASGEVIDLVGGLADLDARILRTIGEPGGRFDEDPLRLLRLVKFATRLGFGIEAETAAAASNLAAGLRQLQPERLFGELTEIFTGPGRGDGLRLLVDLGHAAVVLPEVAAMDGVAQPPEYHPEGDVLTHVALVLDAVPEDDPELAWAAVLHDVGKPPTFVEAADRIRFDGHDVLSATMAGEILGRLRAARSFTEVVVEICRDHIRFASLPQMRPRRRERWLRDARFARHLAFHRADCMGSHGKLEIYDFAARELAALPPQEEILVTGKDVLALGVAAGPQVGELLARVHAAADQAPVAMDRAQALVLLREIADEVRQGGGPDTR